VAVARIRSVAEVVLNVRDIARMSRFYQDTLGFAFHSQLPENEPTIVFLTIGDRGSELARGGHPDMLALIDPARHAPAAGRFDAIERRRSTLNHLAFEIDENEFEAARRRLDQFGLAPTTTAFDFLRAKALFFEDPEGNLLELICHDSSAQGAPRTP
jgi:catechol 2,3-dioxygenase-like lactoylglutathione lyase family enzyme